eukprot:4483931-Amphidinium_carterae.1
MDKASWDVQRDAKSTESYHPLSSIVGFETPVNAMSELAPASGTNVFVPIPWNPECVQPPYEDFYLDGHRIPPYSMGLTEYENLSLEYKGPMVEE